MVAYETNGGRRNRQLGEIPTGVQGTAAIGRSDRQAMTARGRDRLGKPGLARWVGLAGSLALAGVAAPAGRGGDGSPTPPTRPPVPRSYVRGATPSPPRPLQGAPAP